MKLKKPSRLAVAIPIGVITWYIFRGILREGGLFDYLTLASWLVFMWFFETASRGKGRSEQGKVKGLSAPA